MLLLLLLHAASALTDCGSFSTALDNLANSVQASHQRIRVLQIGAHVGSAGDQIWSTMRNHSIDAVFVEPVKSLYTELVKNYCNAKKITQELAIGAPYVAFSSPHQNDPLGSVLRFEQAVITSCDKDTIPFYHLPESLDPYEARRGLPAWASQIGSVSRFHLERHTEIPDRLIVESELPCLAFEQVLARSGWDDVPHLLQIDVEGHDFRILQLAHLRHDWRPRLVRYESKWLSVEDKALARQLLMNVGYDVHPGKEDTWAEIDSISQTLGMEWPGT